LSFRLIPRWTILRIADMPEVLYNSPQPNKLDCSPSDRCPTMNRKEQRVSKCCRGILFPALPLVLLTAACWSRDVAPAPAKLFSTSTSTRLATVSSQLNARVYLDATTSMKGFVGAGSGP